MLSLLIRLFAFLPLIFPFFAGAQPCAFTYDPGARINHLGAIEDAEGNFVFIGRQYTAVDTAGVLPSEIDVSLLKIDARGNELWHRTYDFSLHDEGKAVVAAPDGGYVLLTEVCNRINFVGCARRGLRLIKTTAEGAIQWREDYFPNHSGIGVSLLATRDGGYAITGETNQRDTTSRDVFLLKVDANGQTEWTVILPSRGGWAHNAVELSNGDFLFSSSSIDDTRRIRVSRISADGVELWSQFYIQASFFARLAATSDGNFLVVLIGPGDFLSPDVVKIDGNGQQLWTIDLDEAYNNRAVLAVDGGFIVSSHISDFSIARTRLQHYDLNGQLIKNIDLDPFDTLLESPVVLRPLADGSGYFLAGESQEWAPGFRIPLAYMLLLLDEDGNIKDCTPTATSEADEFSFVDFYPNPFTGQSILELPSDKGEFFFELFDATGRQLRAQPVSGPSFRLERNGLAEGLYSYRLSQQGLVVRRGRLLVLGN